jgi:polyphosphate:AMP phosphotransferase
MFETAELGRKVSKEEYAREEPLLRERLLEVQGRLRKENFRVIVYFGGVDGAGKSESTNLLHAWMDPRWLVTRAFGPPSDEELERPEYWRYWRDLPPRGRIGLFLSAWYSPPLRERVYGKITGAEFEDRLEKIAAFERTLADDGAVILKCWMHLGQKAQKKRFEALEKDPLVRWRVTKQHWEHWRKYDSFVSAAELIIMRTSTGQAPWRIIEGADPRFRSLEVGRLLLNAVQRRLGHRADENGSNANQQPIVSVSASNETPAVGEGSRRVTILSELDLGRKLAKSDYRRQLEKYQGALNRMHRKARDKKMSGILVFEGWDAAGKGGAIRRLVAALDARDYQVIPTSAPSDDERKHHYLWRFWRHLSRAGRVMIFDRSWYGRVLVERVEGFATEREWRRAYAEINDFERQLVDHGIALVKFWIHISKDEQERRFKQREQTPYKRWKITDEDWRNREKWGQYEIAVHDMVERTSTEVAPWVLVEGNDKRYARIKVLKTVCGRLRKALG